MGDDGVEFLLSMIYARDLCVAGAANLLSFAPYLWLFNLRDKWSGSPIAPIDSYPCHGFLLSIHRIFYGGALCCSCS
ncbi:hypothetical protein U1Q18_036343 [Sarracenia purpurea var. burkii]